MLTLIDPALEQFIREHSSPLPEQALFDALRDATIARTTMPQMQVGPIEGQLLRTLVALLGARQIVEVGAFTGYSALAMASALPADGRLITLDVDPHATAIAREFWDRSPWGARIELRLGDARGSLAALAAEGARFDLAFIDADKAGYVDYYEAIVPMLAPRGLIVADNTLWSGKVLAPQDDSDRAIVRFCRHVADDPRTEQVVLSVRDGLTLIRRR